MTACDETGKEREAEVQWSASMINSLTLRTVGPMPMEENALNFQTGTNTRRRCSSRLLFSPTVLHDAKKTPGFWVPGHEVRT